MCCCYLAGGFATAASQNRFCTRKLSLHKKIAIFKAKYNRNKCKILKAMKKKRLIFNYCTFFFIIHWSCRETRPIYKFVELCQQRFVMQTLQKCTVMWQHQYFVLKTGTRIPLCLQGLWHNRDPEEIFCNLGKPSKLS